ncbi:MAG: hypothetical protein HZB57_04595 [Gammaproteobacteria bacterium]|nr:hypothetical protein [Gammaproteobacteria bacterium]
MKAKHLALAGCITAALGMTTAAHAATALSVGFDFKAYVTMLNGNDGSVFRNLSFATEPKFMGYRTPISGHMVIDITENGMIGGASFEPFLFIGSLASGRDVTFVPADSLYGTPIPSNTLMVGNMLFDFGKFVKGIPVSIVFDMGNLSTALMNAKIGDVITGLMRGASDNTVFTMSDGSKRTLPMGPVVAATTTWNTTDVDTDGDGQPGPVEQNTNPSGTVPLLVDTNLDFTNGDIGIGGSPIREVAFVGFSPNFDISELTVTCVNALASCNTSGLTMPSLPALNPQPLEPVQDSLGGLVKGLGL